MGSKDNEERIEGCLALASRGDFSYASEHRSVLLAEITCKSSESSDDSIVLGKGQFEVLETLLESREVRQEQVKCKLEWGVADRRLWEHRNEISANITERRIVYYYNGTPTRCIFSLRRARWAVLDHEIALMRCTLRWSVSVGIRQMVALKFQKSRNTYSHGWDQEVDNLAGSVEDVDEGDCPTIVSLESDPMYRGG
ncbi:hypothetical protein BC628DRAFT_1404917 [Trametes gibbosa]|nr:hypothetical protein BC628DRAFT_1404917 [Trametes gibbosa]